MKLFPSATLIQLYEFLKNSRLIRRSRSTTKKPHAFAGSRFGVETFRGEPMIGCGGG
ncbi:hypothetical protein [Variovorax paradoxus]|jgi:hypothetical protein|uniref:hypothetical protein n=1 Tax=Variovorax paradoxus TaxID=34073 RepID=UPI003995D470